MYSHFHTQTYTLSTLLSTSTVVRCHRIEYRQRAKGKGIFVPEKANERSKKVKSSEAKGLDSIYIVRYSVLYIVHYTINVARSSLVSIVSYLAWMDFPSRFHCGIFVIFFFLLRIVELLPMFSATLNFIYISSSHFATLSQDVGHNNNRNSNSNSHNNTKAYHSDFTFLDSLYFFCGYTNEGSSFWFSNQNFI